MTAIWFILAFMTGGAVLALLWPMSRRAAAPAEAGQAATEAGFYEDQLREIERDLARGLIAPAEAEAARTEAARRLLRVSRDGASSPEQPGIAEPHLRQRRAASAFALSTIPLVALLAYGVYGSPNLPAQTAADRQSAQTSSQDLMKAIGQIEARLASDPNDARGWMVIAPVYMRLGRFDEAAHAYEEVRRIKGESPELLADWGEALVAGGNGVVPPQAKAVFERALVLDDRIAKPRFYLARAAEQAGDIPGAIGYLTTLSETGPPNAPWLPLVRETLARLKGEPAPAPQAKAEAAPPVPGLSAEQTGAIRGMVEGLDARLAKDGGSLDEWMRLIRSRSVLGERDKALLALEKAKAALGSDLAAGERLDAQAKELGLGATPPGQASEATPARTAPQPPTPAAERGDADAAVATVKAMPPAERDAAIRGMVAGLDRRLTAKGGSADEWLRLVRSYSVLGERKQASQTVDRARMALGADAGAVGRLDALAKELDLHGTAGKP